VTERPDDKTRKRLRAQYKQADREAWQAQLPLAPDDHAALLVHLDERLCARGCDHTLTITEAWLAAHDHDVVRVTARFRELGGRCDCEVLANIDPETYI
jgi:hypothetical protein